MNDQDYIGIPWKSGGRTREEGVDCVGLVCLWLRENVGFDPAPRPSSHAEQGEGVASVGPKYHDAEEAKRGDVVFFRMRGKGAGPHHVALCLGDGRFLNIVAGFDSRIERGLTLMRRIGLVPLGALGPSDVEALARALNNPGLGIAEIIIAIVVAVIAFAISYALRPSLDQYRAKHGAYSPEGLLTQKNTEIPLPDLLGSAVTAGNQVYQQSIWRAWATAIGGDGTGAAWNNIVILGSAPISSVDLKSQSRLNALPYFDPQWHNGPLVTGIALNPAQTKAEAVLGQIGGDGSVPSLTIYDGAHDVSVDVDFRSK